MRSRSLKTFVASALIISSISTWSAPAQALRQTEKVEGDKSGLEELARALTTGDLGEVGQTAMHLASAAIPSLRPAPAGLEEKHLLYGHTDVITTFAFSRDGARLVSGSDDGTVRVWDVASAQALGNSLPPLDARGRVIPVAPFHFADRVSSVALDPGGKMLAAGMGNGIRLWDVSSGELIRLFPERGVGHHAAVTGVAFSPTEMLLASGSSDGTVRIWNFQSENELFTLRGHVPGLNIQVAFSPDGRLLASGSGDGTVRLWDPITGKQERVLGGEEKALERSTLPGQAPLETEKEAAPQSFVESIAFSPEGAILAVGRLDGTVQLWDAATGVLVRTFPKQKDWIQSLSFNQEGTRLASTGADSTVLVWDVVSGQALLQTLVGYNQRNAGVLFKPDGTLLISGAHRDSAKAPHHAVWLQGLSVPVAAAGLEEKAPIRILIADTPQRETVPGDIKKLIQSMGLEGKVELIEERGVTGNQQKLKELIEKYEPTIILVFTGQKILLSPYVVHAASQHGTRLVIRAGAGVENFSMDAMTRYRVPFLRSHGLGVSMSDFTIRIIFAGLRLRAGKQSGPSEVDVSQDPKLASVFQMSPEDFDEALRQASKRKRGEMTPDQRKLVFGPLSKREFLELAQRLVGKRVGILGFGVIGQEVSKKLNEIKKLAQVSFEVVATSPSLLDPKSAEARTARSLGVGIVEEKELFQLSDILTVHIPSTEANNNYITSKNFEGRTKPLFFINTARRSLVHDDLFETDQPFELVSFGDLDFDTKILDFRAAHERAFFVTPHIGGLTKGSAEGAVESLLKTLERTLPILLGEGDPGSIQTINGISVIPVVSKPALEGKNSAGLEEYTRVRVQSALADLESYRQAALPHLNLLRKAGLPMDLAALIEEPLRQSPPQVNTASALLHDWTANLLNNRTLPRTIRGELSLYLISAITALTAGLEEASPAAGLDRVVGRDITPAEIAKVAKRGDFLFSPQGDAYQVTWNNQGENLWVYLVGQEPNLAGRFIAGPYSFIPETLVGYRYRPGNGTLLNSKTGLEEIQVLKGHSGEVRQVVFDPKGNTLASVSHDGTIRLWDVKTGQLKTTLPLEPAQGHGGTRTFFREIFTGAFSPNGKFLASGGADGTIRLWDAATGALLKVFQGHASQVLSVAFSLSGQKLVSGSADGAVRVWEVPSGKAAGILKKHRGPVNAVLFSPDGRLVATSADGLERAIYLWDLDTQRVRTLTGHSHMVTALAFSADGTTLFSAGKDKTIRWWDVATGQERRRSLAQKLTGIRGDESWISLPEWPISMALSPDGKLLAVGRSDRAIELWNVFSGTVQVRRAEAHAGSVNSVAFSPDGKILASGGAEGAVTLRDVASDVPQDGVGELLAALWRNFLEIRNLPDVVPQLPEGFTQLIKEGVRLHGEIEAAYSRQDIGSAGYHASMLKNTLADLQAQIADRYPEELSKQVANLVAKANELQDRLIAPTGIQIPLLTGAGQSSGLEEQVPEPKEGETVDGYLQRFVDLYVDPMLNGKGNGGIDEIEVVLMGRVSARHLFEQGSVPAVPPEFQQLLRAEKLLNEPAATWIRPVPVSRQTGAGKMALVVTFQILTAGLEEARAPLWEGPVNRLLPWLEKTLPGHPDRGIRQIVVHYPSPIPQEGGRGDLFESQPIGIPARVANDPRVSSNVLRSVAEELELAFPDSDELPDLSYQAVVLVEGGVRQLHLWRGRSERPIPLKSEQAGLEESELARSSDGQFLVTRWTDEITLHLRYANNGLLIATLSRHKDPVELAVFSLAGERLATADQGGKILLWQVPTGEFLGTLFEFPGKIASIHFEGDGGHLSSKTPDGATYHWDLASRQLVSVDGLPAVADETGVLLSLPKVARPLTAGLEETPHAVFDGLQQAGAHYSYDFLTPNVLADGTIASLVRRKVISAATTNPTSNWGVWQQAVLAPNGVWREEVRELIRKGLTAQEIYDTLFVGHLVKPAAALFRPGNEESKYQYGYVSYEFRPIWAQPMSERDYDAFMGETEKAFKEVMRLDGLLRKELGAHNFFIKVHGTNTGITAAQKAHANGANINYTLLSRREHVRAAMQAHKAGNYAYARAGGRYDRGPAGEAVFSDFVSRTDREIDPVLSDLKLLKAHVDRRLSLPEGVLGAPGDKNVRARLQAASRLYEHLLKPENEAARDTFLKDIAPLKMKAGLAYAKTEIYPLVQEQYLEDAGWQEFMKRTGPRMPQIYWGSTGVKAKDPETGKEVYTTDPHYFSELKGAWTTNTSPPEVIRMLAETPAEKMPFDASLTVEKNLDQDRHALNRLAELGIDIELIQQDVQDKGLKSFAADDAKTFAAIEDSIRQISLEEIHNLSVQLAAQWTASQPNIRIEDLTGAIYPSATPLDDPRRQISADQARQFVAEKPGRYLWFGPDLGNQPQPVYLDEIKGDAGSAFTTQHLERLRALVQAAAGLEEARVVLSFDPAAGSALKRFGIPTYVVVPTPTDFRHELAIGVEPERQIGLVWAGLEEQDYRSINAGIQLLVSADPSGTGWREQVVRAVSQRLGPNVRLTLVYDAGSLASGLEELGVPGATIARVLQRQTEDALELGQMK